MRCAKATKTLSEYWEDKYSAAVSATDDASLSFLQVIYTASTLRHKVFCWKVCCGLNLN